MKSRILRELELLSSGNESQHLLHLINELKFTEEQVRTNASVCMKQILHNYSSFAVSTIDSYFQVLSGALARELNLPFKYDIELDTEIICTAVAESLLDEAGKSEKITRWLRDLLSDKIDEGKGWTVSADLKKMTREIINRPEAREHALNTDTDNLLGLISKLKKIKTGTEETLQSIGTEAAKLISTNGFSIADFAYGAGGPVGYLYKIATISKIPDKYKPGSRTIKAVEDPGTMLTAANRKNAVLFQFVQQSLHPLLCEAVDFYLENERNYLSSCHALKLIYIAGIAGALNDKLVHYRDEFKLFMLSDTTRLLQEMVKDTDAPFIFEKTGNLFRHIMIDEFQDTSDAQWQILKPLILNSLSSGNNVLLVGDAKQSIYRWRGGNMQLIEKGVQEHLKFYSEVISEQTLNTNYRSLDEIVSFNNKFFTSAGEAFSSLELADPTLFPGPYISNQVIQKSKGNNPGGKTEFMFLSPDKSEDSEEESWKISVLKRINEKIGELINRNFRLKDIAILTRTSAHESEIAAYLHQETQYNFISGNSLLLSGNRKIKFLLNALSYLSDPTEPLLYYEISSFIATEKFSDSIPYGKKNIREHTGSWIKENLDKNRNTLLSLPPDTACLKILSMAFANEPDPFTDKFMDIIMDYISHNGTDIREFRQWWDEQVETKNWSVEIPETTDAIRLLSIHKSKGLQFPVVFIPFIDWTLYPKSKSIIWTGSDEIPFNELNKFPLYSTRPLVDTVFSEGYLKECNENFIDNLNLLYVAFTRAENELYGYGSLSSTKDNAGKMVMQVLQQSFPEYISNEINAFHFNRGLETVKVNSVHKGSGSLYEPAPVSPSNINNKVQGSYPDLSLPFKSDETQYGNVIHSILENIRDAKDVEVIINKWITAEFSSHESEIRETVYKAWDLLENEGLNSSDFEILSEAELCDEFGMVYRPDRVLLNDNHAIVIDFKTGSFEEVHKKQVAGYMGLLAKTGISTVKGYLVYTRIPEIHAVETGS